MQLIDAQKAWKTAQTVFSDPVLLCAIQLALEKSPTVDAIPVIRCKDCKHYKSYGPGVDGFESFGKCLSINMDVDMPVCGYCCYGERKEV